VKKLNLLVLLITFAVVPPTIISCPGCMSARQVSYKTLSAIAHTVDTAMKAYADERVAGRVPDETHAKVVDIKLRYEKAFLAAATAAQANLEAPASSDLVEIATQLVNVITAATGKDSK
jgi:hypothetical protein